MSILEIVKARADKLNGLQVEAAPGWVSITPEMPGGFPILLRECGNEWIVEFEGWHEHFDSAEQAKGCVLFGLSDTCRLRQVWRGDMLARTEVQSRSGDGWKTDSVVASIFVPFWRRARVELLQNAHIMMAPA